MVRSSAVTVEQYLSELTHEQRDVLTSVRQVILGHLPPGYKETMNWGMISYEVPLERYPHTYNKQPLSYVALAAQKRYYSLYLMAVYDGSVEQAWLQEEFRRVGKKLDMGKSCLRFRKLDDLPLEIIAQVVASTPPEQLIALYEKSRGKRV